MKNILPALELPRGHCVQGSRLTGDQGYVFGRFSILILLLPRCVWWVENGRAGQGVKMKAILATDWIPSNRRCREWSRVEGGAGALHVIC